MTAAAPARDNRTAYRTAANRSHAYTDAVNTWREVRSAVAAAMFNDPADAAAELRAARAVVGLTHAQWLKAEAEIDAATVTEVTGSA